MGSGGVVALILQAGVTLGVGGALAPLLVALFNRGKTKSETGKLGAEATQVIAQAASAVASQYQQMNEGLVKELREAKAESERARAESEQCRQELRTARVENQETLREMQDLKRKLDIAIDMLTQLGQDVTVIRY